MELFYKQQVARSLRLQLAEPKKEPNGQIYTFQAWVATFYIAPYERIISGWPSPERSHRPDLYISRQNPERSETTRSLHLSLEGNFYIAPYEYFISGWRPIFTEALHFEFAWPYMNSLSAAGQSRERSQIDRSLHFNPGWTFLYCAV